MYTYQQMNIIESTAQPSSLHVADTNMVAYFKRYLLQKAISVFKFKGLPDYWSEDYFFYTLFPEGRIAILNTEKFGVIPQSCTLSGMNVFYEPKEALISNPLLPGLTSLEIGKECVVIRLMPDYGSIMDLIDNYAAQLALCVQTIGCNLVNSQDGMMLIGKNKGSAEALKKAYDQIRRGEPAVAIDNAVFDKEGKPSILPFVPNIGSNYIAGSVLDTMNCIMNQFDTEIGIPNANTDKKERLIVDEVNANNVETFCKAQLWLDTMKKDMKKANAMFGLSLDVELRNAPDFIDYQISGTGVGQNELL